MDKISPKRKRILNFITGFVREKGYSPSVRDIVKGCGISSSSVVQYHLNQLENLGFIHRNREISRSITLAEKPGESVSVPLVGTIAAGEPIPVPDQDSWHTVAIDTVDVPTRFVAREAQVYALRVKGTSMVDALVDNGDIVVLEVTSTADDGQTVAAWITDRQEATLKRLYREPGRIRLQSANQSMSPIYVDPDKIHIQGRVIAVLRGVI